MLDYLQDRAKGSTLYGFRGGPAGIMKCKYVELTSEYIYPYRNQVSFWHWTSKVFYFVNGLCCHLAELNSTTFSGYVAGFLACW